METPFNSPLALSNRVVVEVVSDLEVLISLSNARRGVNPEWYASNGRGYWGNNSPAEF